MTTDTAKQRPLDRLAQLRDELKLKIHLGKADTRDEWDRLEERWHRLQRDLEPVEDASEETAHEVAAAGKLLLEELRDGYRRIRDSF